MNVTNRLRIFVYISSGQVECTTRPGDEFSLNRKTNNFGMKSSGFRQPDVGFIIAIRNHSWKRKKKNSKHFWQWPIGPFIIHSVTSMTHFHNHKAASSTSVWPLSMLHAHHQTQLCSVIAIKYPQITINARAQARVRDHRQWKLFTYSFPISCCDSSQCKSCSAAATQFRILWMHGDRNHRWHRTHRHRLCPRVRAKCIKFVMASHF